MYKHKSLRSCKVSVAGEVLEVDEMGIIKQLSGDAAKKLNLMPDFECIGKQASASEPKPAKVESKPEPKAEVKPAMDLKPKTEVSAPKSKKSKKK